MMLSKVMSTIKLETVVIGMKLLCDKYNMEIVCMVEIKKK